MAAVATPPTPPTHRTAPPPPNFMAQAMPVPAARPAVAPEAAPALSPCAPPPLSPASTSSSSGSSSAPREWPEDAGGPTRAASKGLAPLSAPVCVRPQFVRDEQTVIVLKDAATMFDKRLCDVRDAHGTILLTVKDHIASLVQQKGESGGAWARAWAGWPASETRTRHACLAAAVPFCHP